jgi:tetratricopeptide (TPR) repeat protein
MQVQRTKRSLSHLRATACVLLALGGRAFAQTGANAVYQRGVTALHLFEYEDANEAFTQARQIDPALAMAYWGEAMTWHQSLWGHENVEAGRAALARLAPTPAARMAKAARPRDQALLAAVDRLFGEGRPEARRRAYAEAMGQLYAREPDDPDIASFYALALLGTMTRGLIGTADAHEGHSAGLAGSQTQAQVSTILDKVLRSTPQHTGALHYLIHDDDDPAHARLALDAARTLARLAPDSSHTRHMPAHIFLQLGQWHDAAESDMAALAASDAWIARKHLPAAMRNFHALAWLQYEQLQLGRYREARQAIDQIAPVVSATGDLTLLSDLSSMRARYIIETASWRLMTADSPFGNANELFALGISAARSGNVTVATRAQDALGQRARDPREGDLRPAIAIMERELAALVAFADGRNEESIALLRGAAAAEAQLPAPLGLPAPIKPAPELLGEVLTEAGRPGDAIAAFEAALARNANRSLSVLGLARAAAASGRPDVSRRRYTELLASFDSADADLPALREARAALAALAPMPAADAVPPAARALLIAAVALASAIVAVIVVGVRRKKRGPVSLAPRRTSNRRR